MRYLQHGWVALVLFLQLTVIASAETPSIACWQELDPTFTSEQWQLPRADAIFGKSVSAHGMVTVVGAHSDFTEAVNQGTAYVFERYDTTWERAQILIASDFEAGDAFGTSVAVWGDIIAVGAIGDDNGFPWAGAAYIFRRTRTGWSEEQKLLAPDAGWLHQLGWSIALDEDVLAIGANGHNDHTGAVYVYRFNGVSWNLEQILSPSDGMSGDQFGWSVAVDGELIVAGAGEATVNGVFAAGAAYVYRHNGTTWVEETKLTIPNLSQDHHADAFGKAIDVDGNKVAVGSKSDDEAGDSAGAVFVFHHDKTGLWSLSQKLIPHDAAAGHNFGISVDIKDSWLVVSDDKHTMGRGSAYLFKFAENQWSEHTQYFEEDSETNSHFGIDIAITTDSLVVGATAPSNDRGNAYIFDMPSVNPQRVVPGKRTRRHCS